MEFDIPMFLQKGFEGRIDEFCEGAAKAIAHDTVSSMAIVGTDVKYEDCSWLEEHEKQYANGILYFEE